MGVPVPSLSPGDPGWEPSCPTAQELVAPRVRAGVPGVPASLHLPDGIDPGAFRNWNADTQQRALDLLQARTARPWRPFYCPDQACSGEPHGNWTWNHARADQRPPSLAEDWLVWLLMGGRGGGKTRTGAEVTHKATKLTGRIALIAPTGPDFRDTMVEGVSGILATSPPGKMPLFEPSKKKLTWPNGAIAQGFSGEEPDRLRGPQHGWAWIDEPAHMPLIKDVWDMLLFGLRIEGEPCRIVATTTPVPSKWMKGLAKDPKTRISRFSTHANLMNLAETFKQTILDRYEGTRLGLQELHGQILEDVEGSLWNIDIIQYVDELPEDLDRVIVAVDPAGSCNKDSDETGIIVIGVKGKILYVMADRTGKYSPSGWATMVVNTYHAFSADAVVVERNYGADMVREVLEKNGAEDIRIIEVISRRGKAIRAEPIVALYEKERVYHLRGAMESLEDEQLTWVPGSKSPSPNRIDAMVHGATELARLSMPVSVASPSSLNIRMDTVYGR